MGEAGIPAQVMTAVVSMGLSAIGTVVVLKTSMAWHKEKLERHSQSLKAAFKAIDDLRADGFTKHEQQQKHIHQLEIEIARTKGNGK